MKLYRPTQRQLRNTASLVSWQRANPDVRLDLQHMELEGCELTGADLSGAVLDHAILRNLELSYANLSSASMRNTSFIGCSLARAVLCNAEMQGVSMKSTLLTGVNLQGANVSYANLAFSSFLYADISRASLVGSSLIRSEFILSNLSYADFSEANLEHSSFIDSVCYSTNFRNANRAFCKHALYDDSENCPPLSDIEEQEALPAPELIEVNLIQYFPEYFKREVIGWSQERNHRISILGIPYPGTVICHANKHWLIRQLIFGSTKGHCTVHAHVVTLKELHEESISLRVKPQHSFSPTRSKASESQKRQAHASDTFQHTSV